MARTDSGDNRDSGIGGAGTPGSGASSGGSSGGRGGGSTGSSSSSGGRGSSSSSSSGERTGGIHGEGGGGGSYSSGGSRSSSGTSSGEGGSRSSGSSGSGSGNSRDGGTGSASSASGGRSSTGVGTVGGGLAGAAGMPGSGMAEKGDRVTGGVDSGRFGDSDKGGRVTGSQSAGSGRASSASAPDSGRFGGGSSTGRQSSSGGNYSNGGTNSDRTGTSARASASTAPGSTASAPSARGTVGGGLAGAAGMTPPSVSARAAEDASMGKLAASRTPPAGSPRRAEDASMKALAATTALTSPNYGAGFARSARAAEDMSMNRQRAWDGLLGSLQRAEAQKAPNPATGRPDPYNGLVNGRGTPTHANLTDMTIAEVQAYQSNMLGRGHASTAVGAYQMLSGTLAEQARVMGYDPNTTKFSRSVQDELARSLADDKRASQASRMRDGLTPENYARALAQEWAGLATANGRSHHAGDGRNRASVGYSDTLAAAMGLVGSGAVGRGKSDRVTSDVRTASVAPTPTPRPEREDRGRLPGLAGVAPSHMPANAISTFDRSRLNADLNPILDGIAAVRPDAQIRSGYRDPSHNARVNGAKQSQHMQGRAVDIDMRGWTDQERRAVLDAAIASGARGIGIYNGGTSLHVDARPSGRAMWGGNPTGAYDGMTVAQAPGWARESLAAWQGGAPVSGSRRAVETAIVAPGTPSPTPAPRDAPTRTAAASTLPALPAPRTVADRPVASIATPAVERFAATYLGSAPTPTARPDNVTAKPERSMGDKMVAGAIDVGVGLLPGIGTAAGLYGMAAPMLGLPSVGEMALGMRDRNQLDPTINMRESAGGNGDDRLTGAQLAGGAAAPPPPSVAFAEKYLGWVDDGIARPTPVEKWGAMGANPVRYSL